MFIDELLATIDGNKINIDAPVDLATMDNWAAACLIGRTVSLILNGYEDDFDGMDWEAAAEELRKDAKDGEQFTRRTIIKALDEMGYNLPDYA